MELAEFGRRVTEALDGIKAMTNDGPPEGGGCRGVLLIMSLRAFLEQLERAMAVLLELGARGDAELIHASEHVEVLLRSHDVLRNEVYCLVRSMLGPTFAAMLTRIAVALEDEEQPNGCH